MTRNKLWVVALLLSLVAVACGGDHDRAGSEDSPSRVIGLITEIEPPEGDAPTNFTVEEEDGDTYSIDIDPEFDYGFNLRHVYVHFEQNLPVDVSIEERDGALVATAIEDA